MKLDNTVRALPIWIQLPSLPWEFWTVNMLNRIGSIYGKPLYCDKCILLKLKLGYARMLVEIDSSGEFPEMIVLVDEKGNVIQQKVI